jgi:hypothetical protein
MMVAMAVATTMMTTPALKLVLPEKYVLTRRRESDDAIGLQPAWKPGVEPPRVRTRH